MTKEKDAFVAEKVLAVVGVSRKGGFGKRVYGHLKARGYRVFAVNSQADEIDGERCYRRLADVPERVGGVVTVVPPEVTEKIVEECGELGIKKVWMQQGSESAKAVARCGELGIAVVHGDCVMMYTEAGFPHSVHRGIRKMMGRY